MCVQYLVLHALYSCAYEVWLRWFGRVAEYAAGSEHYGVNSTCIRREVARITLGDLHVCHLATERREARGRGEVRRP